MPMIASGGAAATALRLRRRGDGGWYSRPMGLRINRTLSVWDGDWVDTSAETPEDAGRQFARRRGWQDGDWSVVSGVERLDAYHHPVARRRFQVLRRAGASEEIEVQASAPVGFVVPGGRAR